MEASRKPASSYPQVNLVTFFFLTCQVRAFGFQERCHSSSSFLLLHLLPPHVTTSASAVWARTDLHTIQSFPGHAQTSAVRVPEDMPVGIPENMPDRMPERMSKDMPGTQGMPERMSKDAPVRLSPHTIELPVM